MVVACVEGRKIGIAALRSFLTRGCLVQDPSGRVWIGWGEVRRSARPQKGQLSLYAPDFFLRDDQPWRIYEHSASIQTDELIADLEGFADPVPSVEWTPSPFAQFDASFDDIQRRLADGTLAKAVPFIARRARTEFTPGQRATLLTNALRRGHGTALRAYGVWDADGGLIGMTPETLFEVGGGRLTTMALAGTRTPDAPSLLDDPKELHEHRVVIEGIVEQLEPLGEVVVGRTDELRLPALIHLHTPIEAFPDRRVEFDAWVAALHPTAAIGAWPRAEGWRWLEAQPNAEERDRYGAPFGLVPPESEGGVCLVAIRNLQWADGEAKLFAGCGIVAASRVEREWRELNAKLDSVQGALGL